MSRGRGVDQKGRSKKDASHVRFYQFELDTVAFRSLMVGPRALLIELKSLYNGSNNGELFMSVREAARRLNIGKDAASDCLDDLQDRGFIRPKVAAGFDWKTAARARKATCWILTEYATEDSAPTRDFQKWTPTAASKRVPEIIRRSALRDSGGPESRQTVPESRQHPPSLYLRADSLGEKCPISPGQLSLRADTDSYQGQAVGKPRGAEPPHSEAQRHAAGAPQRIHLACQTDAPGAAAAGLGRDETPSASPEGPSKVVKITRGKISAANRA